MIGVQLGWLSDALNWVFKKILNPVFDWLSGLLSTAFSWIFNEVLQPVLNFVFETFLAEVLHSFLYSICAVLLGIFYLFLKIVDAIVKLFQIFAGISPVTMTMMVNNVKTETTGSILVVLFKTPFVRKSIFTMMAIGFALCFLFALIAVIRSIFDFDGREGHPVSRVIRMTAHAMLRLIFGPIFGLFMLVLSTAILTSLNNAFAEDGGEFSIARTIFVITTFDAVEVKKNSTNPEHAGFPPKDYNTSTGSKASFTDHYRGQFYAKGDEKNGDLMYDFPSVDKTFDIVKINYLQGYLLCLAFIVLLISSLLIFLCRIFDVLLLLIMEPLFVAPMPFDEGEHYEKWQELFIGKLFSGYGMVVAMNLYLIVAGSLFGGKISLVDPSGPFAALEDGLIKLIFMLGGAFAVLNLGPLVTSILSQTAANAEMQQSAVMSGFMYDYIMNPSQMHQAIRGAAWGKVKQGFSGKGTTGKTMGKGDHGFSPSKAPKHGAGSVPGLGGAGRAYAMSTMLSTPQKTMKFSNGKSVDEIVGGKVAIDQATVKGLSESYGTKPAAAPSGKPEIDQPTVKGLSQSYGSASTTGGDGSFSSQSGTQAKKASDLGVTPATQAGGGTTTAGGTTAAADPLAGTDPLAQPNVDDMLGSTIPTDTGSKDGDSDDGGAFK
ncbi:MAG: hypothetical protein K6G16_08065 [Lachnospiraceae bacterium]|nr:hypothetical protein [Lachnospiraceae bacterium]